MLWLTGGALALCVIMIVGLLALVVRMGLGTFWPRAVDQYTLTDGSLVMGEVRRTDSFTPDEGLLATLDPETRERAEAEMSLNGGELGRRLVRTANNQLTNTHFTWVLDASISESAQPDWAIVLERTEWGQFVGFPKAFRVDGEVVTEDPAAVWARYLDEREGVAARISTAKDLQKNDLGRLAHKREEARLAVRQLEIDLELPESWVNAHRGKREAREALAALADDAPADARSFRQSAVDLAERKFERLEAVFADMGEAIDPSAEEKYEAGLADYAETIASAEAQNSDILDEIREQEAENARFELQVVTASGQEKTIPLAAIVRGFTPNQLGGGDKAGVYFSRWGEFLTADPRAANSEGGVFPAIVGTVLLTLIMALLVVPFGVMAALYLREYARGGIVISIVRIAINNLAGVPSIVFGVFGLGFFCYGVGGFIDAGPSAPLPKPTWFIALAILAVVAVVSFLCTIAGVTRPGQPAVGKKKIFRSISGALWLITSLAGLGLIATAPFFDGFFQAQLPNPTFGKTALIWASFTLALLTLPVVIVATEEALSAVPNSMREGSYACGASKWQTIKRIVLPRALPGVMTGMILAMARGAGEVAPLMVVGAVKLAPELPISASPGEYFGVNRSFMHLGFHIYDLGFQSQNSEASKPLVFTTTLLLVTIVAFLNISAIWLRGRLKRRFVGMKF